MRTFWPCWVPGGTLSTTRFPSRVRTLIFEPSKACARLIGVVPINLAQALLGSKIKVRTLDGKRVVLKVPPGTQHGQKVRIPGQEDERNGRRGDQYEIGRAS